MSNKNNDPQRACPSDDSEEELIPPPAKKLPSVRATGPAVLQRRRPFSLDEEDEPPHPDRHGHLIKASPIFPVDCPSNASPDSGVTQRGNRVSLEDQCFAATWIGQYSVADKHLDTFAAFAADARARGTNSATDTKVCPDCGEFCSCRRSHSDQDIPVLRASDATHVAGQATEVHRSEVVVPRGYYEMATAFYLVCWECTDLAHERCRRGPCRCDCPQAREAEQRPDYAPAEDGVVGDEAYALFDRVLRWLNENDRKATAAELYSKRLEFLLTTQKRGDGQ